MAQLLFDSDLPFINKQLSHPLIAPHFNNGNPFVVDETSTIIFYRSDDMNDMACFERTDQRIHVGHNAFTSPLKQALINANDIITHHFNLFPLLEIIVGYTPYDLLKTRIFNIKLGFKLTNLRYNIHNKLCYRYELRREDYANRN